MASLPDSHVFDILNRFPSQNFKISYREFKACQGGNPNGIYTNQQTFRIPITGAVNEFILLDDSTLDFEQASYYTLGTRINGEVLNSSMLQPAWRPALSMIGSVRETVNSGSLQTYSNTERTSFNVYQAGRFLLTRGPLTYDSISSNVNVVIDNLVKDASDNNFYNPNSAGLQGLESAGFCNRGLRTCGFISKAKPEAPATVGPDPQPAIPAVPKTLRSGALRPVSIPMTAISTIFNSSSVIPIGLMSTYSAQSYQLEVRLASNIEAISQGGSGFSAGEEPNNFYVCNPRIRVKIIKVLQNETMEAILALYNKSEEYEVASGMKVPLSLQLNSLQINHHQYSVPQGQSEYCFSIPTTAASLRGLAFRFVRNATINGVATMGPQSIYPLSDDVDQNNQLVVKEFRMEVGGECILQNGPGSYSVQIPSGAGGGPETYFVNEPDQWFRSQRRLGGHLFSAKHHMRDAQERDGIESLVCASSVGQLGPVVAGLGRPYVICLENMNHFENSGVASGLDMRSIGNVTIRMKLGQLLGGNGGTEQSGATQNLTEDYTLFLMTSEDYVLEVSRVGIKDVSSQVL